MALDACASPVLIDMPDTCGCAVTKCTLQEVTPETLDSEDWRESGLDRVYAQMKEARAVGVQEHTLTDLFLSRMKPKAQGKLGENMGQSWVAPYWLEPSPGVINENYFQIESGHAHPLIANRWHIVVKQSPSAWATDIPALERYFLAGHYAAIHFVDANGVGRTIRPQIISATNADAGGVHKAEVVIEANETLAGFAALTAAEQAVFQPTGGALQILGNSVADSQSWCHNKPSNIAWKWRDFWWQTLRNTYCVNDEYIKALNDPHLSEYFKKFRSLPLAQRRRQEQAMAEREFYNTIFWGDKMNELQTVENFRQMTPLYDPADLDCCIGYPSNTVGIVAQLAACNRVIDFSGGPLDMDEIMANVMTLARWRGQATGTDITRVEAWTDRATLNNIRFKWIPYIKNMYGFDAINIVYQPGQKMVYDLTGRIMFRFDVFTFLNIGIELAIITDVAFDDYLLNFPAGHENAGRYFMLLDWSDIDIFLAKAKSVNRTNNLADDLYKCVIDPIVTRYLLESKTISVAVHDPNRHLIYKNFSTNCPILTPTPCTEYE